MKIQYIITKGEIDGAKQKLWELKQAALLSRDAGMMQDNREYYLRAKGLEDALIALGILRNNK